MVVLGAGQVQRTRVELLSGQSAWVPNHVCYQCSRILSSLSLSCRACWFPCWMQWFSGVRRFKSSVACETVMLLVRKSIFCPLPLRGWHGSWWFGACSRLRRILHLPGLLHVIPRSHIVSKASSSALWRFGDSSWSFVTCYRSQRVREPGMVASRRLQAARFL